MLELEPKPREMDHTELPLESPGPQVPVGNAGAGAGDRTEAPHPQLSQESSGSQVGSSGAGC